MKKTFYILSLLVVIFFSSCHKSDQAALIGYWEQIPHTKPDSVQIFWQFYPGDALDLYEVIHGEVVDTITFTYTIESSTLGVVVNDMTEFSSRGLADQSGEYWVDVLKKDDFKATKSQDAEGSYVYNRIELIRK